MIDININAIFSQALAAAVQQALQPLQQEYANKMGQIAQQIAALETRLLALENNPAQGVDTTLERRVAALEAATQPGETLERLDNQEWFWNKIRNFTDTVVEKAIEEHNEHWDHDDLVTEDRLEDKLDDYVKNVNFRDEIEDVLNNATLSIRL